MRNHRNSRLVAGVSRVALSVFALHLGISQAQAQDTPDADEPSEIVVTGSRLTTGFETATPVTVLSAETLSQQAPNNIADALVSLPQFNGSIRGAVPSTGASNGTNGQNTLNLRGLGNNRVLVLLDGHRLVSSNYANAVDVNILPQNLVSRVDVVTAGASAAYGSDAVAGAVNFVLDTRFKGLKGEFGGGISTYGDLDSQKVSLAWGDSFLDDRLHIVASAQYFRQSGIGADEKTGRAWFDTPAGLLPNTASKTPTNLVLPNIRSSIGTYGGLITSGPLAGTQFLNGGVPAPFTYGYNSGTAFASGGDGAAVNIGFTPDQWRTANFVHAEYDISDNSSIYGEFLYSRSHSSNGNEVAPETGSYQFTIYSGNPFLPASIQQQMTARNIASFTFGRYLGDFPLIYIRDTVSTTSWSVGIKGRNAFGMPGWRYDVSFTSGRTHQLLSQDNLPISRNIYAAVDAVINPATGQVVCRSTLSGYDAGCKPLNLFGANSVSPDAIPWAIGNSWQSLELQQDVFQANLSGDFGEGISLGAGPISWAIGGEYRRESAVQTTDALSPTINDFTGVRGTPRSLAGAQGPFRFNNPLPFSGKYDVKEIFGELGIPLFKDVPFARSLSTDLAVRHTDYSQAGAVTTWKVGLDYRPIGDIRFRGAISRDIRAPSLLELFNSASQSSSNRLYPSSTNGTTTPAISIKVGNPNLKPEVSTTRTAGVVLTPSFLPGLSMSADYFDIKIDGAIAINPSQNTLDYCALGLQQYCDQISFANGVVTILTPSMNLNSLEVAGYDFEASYATKLLGNPLSLRLLATHLVKNESQAPGAPPLQLLGGPLSPSWKLNMQAKYAIGDLNLFFQLSHIAEVKMDPQYQQGVYTDNNRVPGIFYADATISYDVKMLGASSQIYLTVNNLFNQDPPIALTPPTSFSQPTNRLAYDSIGRYFSAGMRFKF